jgi:hypothetical protein
MIGNVLEPQRWLRVFPAAEDVFIDDERYLHKHLHPLLSIELSAIDPALQGWVHLLSPIEPYECYIGDHTGQFHNEYTCGNWISFRLEADGRYLFLGDRRYFFLENEDL